MTLFFAFLFIFCFPLDALAWGPGVHMAIGNHVLTHVHVLGPVMATLLSAHSRRFLYGCLAADIFIGKGSVFTPTHSHNWDTGRALLRQADSPQMTAYAYGYLSHLAADVIAHNYLVPNMLGFSAGRGKVAHTYIEMLADLRVKGARSQASGIFQEQYVHEDCALVATMQQKQFPFTIKKKLFYQGLRLVEKSSCQQSLRVLKKIVPRTDQDELMDEAIGLARELVMDFLCDPCHSPILECDPIGSANLLQIRHFRRSQRRYYKRHEAGIIFPLDTRLEARLCSWRRSYV